MGGVVEVVVGMVVGEMGMVVGEVGMVVVPEVAGKAMVGDQCSNPHHLKQDR